ncbi:hypothetical protein KFL01_31360 [Kocuria flava]|uniref:Ppx/GppA family phosphatase n=3 Tax=Micrococcaceae TaxID=1268 RepID=A0ABQ0X8T7_9MICC|nr:hypothetical protein KFL01_31360 [Kocuria flava]
MPRPATAAVPDRAGTDDDDHDPPRHPRGRQEARMSKRGRKRKDRRKGGANHGKRPNA